MPTRSQVTMGLIALPVALAACGSRDAVEGGASVTVDRGVWEKVGAKRIIFAHQSVGWNILDGIAALMEESGASLNVAETRAPPNDTPGLYHFMVGANEDPLGKIRDFEALLSNPSFPAFDIAILKLCYVDFKVDSEAEAIAAAYLAAFSRLEALRPSARWVAMTAPLMAVPTGPKEWLKSLLGRNSAVPAENAKRYAFNQVLRRDVPADRLFDLARLESGGAMGESEALRANLTDDGGHLNAAGQRLAAKAFLDILAA